MTHTDHTAPFDRELDEPFAADLSEAFWGRETSWRARTSGANRTILRTSDDTTGTLHAVRVGVSAFRPQRVELRDATGQVRRTRRHGAPTGPSIADRRAGATIGDLAAGHFDEPVDVEPVPLSPTTSSSTGSGAVDPLLARMGILLLVGILLVPLALALRPGDASGDAVLIGESTSTPAAAGAAGAAGHVAAEAEANTVGALVDGPAPTPETGAAAAGSSDAAAPETTGASAAASSIETTAGSTQPSTWATTGSAGATSSSTMSVSAAAVGQATESVGSGIDSAATVDATAERVIPSCPQTYTAVSGDSWYGIAEAAGVTPSAVMGQNNATIDTVIFPGDEICLPADARVPEPPSTTTAPAPDSTTPSTAAPTTTTPTTTPVPTTAPAGSPGRDATVDEVKAVIRSVFPESEWETAYTIAQRESRFVPTAYNGWCCYGVFQIYWNVHRSWLDDLGIDSADDLFDPLLNTRAAFAIWQRAGNSWSPWSTYDG